MRRAELDAIHARGDEPVRLTGVVIRCAREREQFEYVARHETARTLVIALPSSSGNSSDTRGSPRRCHRTIAARSSISSGAKPRSWPLRTRYAEWR